MWRKQFPLKSTNSDWHFKVLPLRALIAENERNTFLGGKHILNESEDAVICKCTVPSSQQFELIIPTEAPCIYTTTA